ncbi:MAG: glycoside hydrolase family 3 C-terminal domain-containing protein, partial [Ruthenibacterium sp.]
ANNQEHRRMSSSSEIDERTLREIYLAPFETTVRKAKPWTVMCSYNRINGTFSAENRWLLTDVLRDEWGFDGYVMTDWGAVVDRVTGIEAGLDLEMPASGGANDARIVAAVRDGSLPESAVDICAQRVVTLLLKAKESRKPNFRYDAAAHNALARKIAEESAVLLKHHDTRLPAAPPQSIAVIGAFAKMPRYQGAGSSKINPLMRDCAFDALCAESKNIVYADGYSLESTEPDEALMAAACEAATGKDLVFLFAGLPDAAESEGFDRTSLAMPENHNRLIEKVSAVNPNVVVILQCGAPILMPWKNSVKAILLTYLGGQAGGGACADLLFGRKNPCGKLAETFPLSLEDTPAFLHFGKNGKTVEYRESIFTGYRWYDAAHRDVTFPFGYGLSYTTFSVENLTLQTDEFAPDDTLTVTVTVKNTGKCAGAEVVQLYVEAPQNAAIYRAPQTLKDFSKVFLAPGEHKIVSFTLDARSFAYYNTLAHAWAVESGKYAIAVGTSSRNICARQMLTVQGDGKEALLADVKQRAPIYDHLPQKDILDIDTASFEVILGRKVPPTHAAEHAPFTVNSTLGDIQNTPVGKQLLQTVSAQAGAMGEEMQSMLSAMLLDLPLRALTMMSGGAMNPAQIEGIVNALNAAQK